MCVTHQTSPHGLGEKFITMGEFRGKLAARFKRVRGSQIKIHENMEGGSIEKKSFSRNESRMGGKNN